MEGDFAGGQGAAQSPGAVHEGRAARADARHDETVASEGRTEELVQVGSFSIPSTWMPDSWEKTAPPTMGRSTWIEPPGGLRDRGADRRQADEIDPQSSPQKIGKPAATCSSAALPARSPRPPTVTLTARVLAARGGQGIGDRQAQIVVPVVFDGRLDQLRQGGRWPRRRRRGHVDPEYPRTAT